MSIKIDGSGDILGSPSTFATGDFKFAMRKSAPAGWVAANGSTIGKAGSGATLAGDAALALFTLWWADYTDAQLPMLTSAGAASTRGASAAADWAANKRLTVFDMVTAGHFPRPAGPGVVNGTKYGDAMQGHGHSVAGNVSGTPGGNYTGVVMGTPSALGQNFSTWQTVSNPTPTDQGPPRVGAETVPKHIGMLPLFKL